MAHGAWHKALRSGSLASLKQRNQAIRWCHWAQGLQVFAGLRKSLVSYNSAITVVSWLKALVIFEELRESLLPDVISYNSSMKAQRWQRAGLFLAQICSAGLLATVVTSGTVIKRCEDSSQWRAAVSICAFGLQKNVIIFNATISSLEKAHRWTEAAAVFRSLLSQQLLPTVTTCNALITACGQAARWECALSAFQDMQRLQLLADLISSNALMSACGNAKQWQLACCCFSKLRSPDKVSYSTLVSALEGLHWQQALMFLKEALERSSGDVMTCNAAMSVCGERSEWLQALHIWDSLMGGSLRPTRVTYNAALSTCERAELWIEALNLFTEAVERSIQSDLIAQNALLSSFGKRLHWQRALSSVLELGTVTLGTMINACERSSQWSRAFFYCIGVADVVACSGALNACKRLARWHDALWLLGKSSSEELRELVASFAPWPWALRLHGAEASAMAWGSLIPWRSSWALTGLQETALQAIQVLAGDEILGYRHRLCRLCI